MLQSSRNKIKARWLCEEKDVSHGNSTHSLLDSIFLTRSSAISYARSRRDTGKLKIFRKQAESVIFHRSLILGKKNWRANFYRTISTVTQQGKLANAGFKLQGKIAHAGFTLQYRTILVQFHTVLYCTGIVQYSTMKHPERKWQKNEFWYSLNDEELDEVCTQHRFESWSLRFGECWSSAKTTTQNGVE